MPITGWKLDRDERIVLLARLPPHWPDVIADHVTLDGDAAAGDPLPEATGAEIVGEADDGAGVQAMVVAIDGSTDRPDGSTYHVTWSLDRARGRTAIESNDVIRECGWRPLDAPIPIAIRPVWLDWSN